MKNVIWSFEGVCVNYRHPAPRRGEPRVGSAPNVAETVQTLQTLQRVETAQNSVRRGSALFYNTFGTFCRNGGPIFGPNL